MLRAALPLALTATAALSQGLGLPPLTDQFATCVGRLAAMMEFQWIRDDPATAATSDQLDTMRELLAAVNTPEMAGLVMARENEAKLAFERLLSVTEGTGADWAKTRVASELTACNALLLD